ncbi:MAG: GNAT family N-acetyltransferase [Nocardioides sp.]
MTTEIEVRVDDLTTPEVERFLTDHFNEFRGMSPAESCHVLDLTGLRRPEVTVWTARLDNRVVGAGALKQLEAGHGEIKSMRTAKDFRGRGIGGAMLRQLMAAARSRNLTRLSLETGADEFFAPARRLYRRHGFVECPPFAEYRPDPLSVFLTCVLNPLPPDRAAESRLAGDLPGKTYPR